MGFGAGASQLARLWEEQVRPATKKTASWFMKDPDIRSAAASAGLDVGGAEDGRVHLSAAAKAVLGSLACEGGGWQGGGGAWEPGGRGRWGGPNAKMYYWKTGQSGFLIQRWAAAGGTGPGRRSGFSRN